MRTLTLTAAGLAVSALLAFSAQAATLTMVADKSTYTIGETISITITGDSQGGVDNAIFGTVVYSGGLVSNLTRTQTPHTSFGGGLPWTVGVLQLNNPTPNTADAFNQLAGINSFPVDQLQIATQTYSADAAGVASFSWLTSAGTLSLDFFGLTTATGTSVTIIPEPTTAALLGMGLLGLAVAGRRR